MCAESFPFLLRLRVQIVIFKISWERSDIGLLQNNLAEDASSEEAVAPPPVAVPTKEKSILFRVRYSRLGVPTARTPAHNHVLIFRCAVPRHSSALRLLDAFGERDYVHHWNG